MLFDRARAYERADLLPPIRSVVAAYHAGVGGPARLDQICRVLIRSAIGSDSDYIRARIDSLPRLAPQLKQFLLIAPASSSLKYSAPINIFS